MNNIFITDIIIKKWISFKSNIEKYYDFIEHYNFTEAKKKANEWLDKCIQYEKKIENKEMETVLNDLYMLKVIIEILIEYASYWKNIYHKELKKSWVSLQNILDTLRTLKRFTKADSTDFFNFFVHQCENLEKIYPYKIFASTEILYDKIKCTICGENMDSFDCQHIRGELYYGKMACGIPEKIELRGVAFVTEPQDKRCVIEYPDNSPRFSVVDYLSELIAKKRLNPLRFSHIEFSKINVTEKIGRNKRCPCGSGKKYKKCCIEKEVMQKEHVNIIDSEKNCILIQTLVNLF